MSVSSPQLAAALHYNICNPVSMLGSREKFNQRKDILANLYAGQLCHVILSEQSLTYTWYAQDKDGHAAEFDKTGKVIYLSAADIDSILTLQCDVSN